MMYRKDGVFRVTYLIEQFLQGENILLLFCVKAGLDSVNNFLYLNGKLLSLSLENCI